MVADDWSFVLIIDFFFFFFFCFSLKFKYNCYKFIDFPVVTVSKRMNLLPDVFPLFSF